MKKKKWKIREKSLLWYFKEIATSLWIFVIIGIMILVIIAFSRPPEAAGAVMKIHIIEQSDKLYDIPLEADLQLHIKELCETCGVDMPLVLAVIGQESNYDPTAIGDNGESIGLMQIQPKHHEARMERLRAINLSDPYQNVTVGIDILTELIKKENGWEWALTAYNAGSYKADYYKSLGEKSEYAESVLKLREYIMES